MNNEEKKHIAGQLKTVGIADSVNDYHMILNGDHGFLPANASPKLLELLKSRRRPVIAFGQPDSNKRKSVFISRFKYTRGVVDILHHFHDLMT